MRWRKFVFFCLLQLFSLSIIESLLPQQFTIGIKKVDASPDTLPSNGDAWTENNNATYPWYCITYKDTIEFATDDKKVGTCALRVKHTSSSAYMKFRLDLGSRNNVTDYDYISFYVKWTTPVSGKMWTFRVFYNIYYCDDYQITNWQYANDTWLKVVVPLKAFILRKSGSIPTMTWEMVQFIEWFIIKGGLGSDDGSTIYIDGLHFGKYSTVTVSNSLRDLSIPNFYAFYPKFAERTTTNGSQSFTTLYDFNYIRSGNGEVSDIESEVLGHTLVALCLAYNKTKDSELLSKINIYAGWLARFANADTEYGGIYKMWNDAYDKWHVKPSITTTGWAMAGLVYAYAVTGNTTYSDAANVARKWYCDYMWNDARGYYYTHMNLTSGVKTPPFAVGMGMENGATITGLASYYRFISQNNTIKTQLNKYLMKIAASTLGGANNTFCGGGEATGYTQFGFFEAYKAFSNQTYLTWAKYAWEVQAGQYEIRSDGSNSDPGSFYARASGELGQGEAWGTSTRLMNLMRLYEVDSETSYKLLYEKATFDYFQAILRLLATGLDQWALERYPNYDKTYVPTQAWIYASLILYKYNIEGTSEPFIILTNKLISATYSISNMFKFTVSGSTGTTSTTKVYVGDKGKPSSVRGSDSWSYSNTTKIVTVNKLHRSLEKITLKWRGSK